MEQLFGFKDYKAPKKLFRNLVHPATSVVRHWQCCENNGSVALALGVAVVSIDIGFGVVALALGALALGSVALVLTLVA